MDSTSRAVRLNTALMLLVSAVLAFSVNSTFIFFLGIFFALLLWSKRTFALCASVALIATSMVTALIILSLVTQTVSFFRVVSPMDFFFGTVWAPNGTIIDGQVEKLFGILPLLFGTTMVALIGSTVGTPIGIGAAIALTYFIPKKVRNVIKPIIEIMAGIPTVIYGYFSLAFVPALVQKLGHLLHLNISTESALSAGIVIGIMIIPLVTSLTDDLLRTTPKSLYYGAAALGSTQTEIILRAVLPNCLPGIVAIVLLGFSRAVGETMVVLMLTGISANIDYNIFHTITTVTVQIVTILTGDQTLNTEESLSAYALGMTLFILTWILNAVSMSMSKRHAHQTL
ncbi:phosphate ABC transporter permease [Neorickettsia sp. 179522]|nr:phosphate ABC transporter permease [Neorickettsia sp. 179522]